MTPIRRLRWYIGFVLFLSTTINYIDRQTLSVLAPYIKTEFQWNNETFALVIISFRIAYTIGQTLCGRMVDWLGVRTGLTLSVAFYSLSAMLGSFTTGLRSLCGFRFLLGLGEAANWPGAAKTVSEWFPKTETGWAVALYDSGSAIGAAVAPFIVFFIYHQFGGWRPAFLITGILGLLWIPLFRSIYRPPETHPRLDPEERKYILDNRPQEGPATTTRLPYSVLLRQPKTWAIIIAKMCTDPVWFFITDWFAIYLVSRGYKLETSLLAFWVPFVAADVGNFVGGGLSSYLVTRGWPLAKSRRVVAAFSAVGMSFLGATVFFDGFPLLVTSFAIATLAYAALSTIILALPADLYPSSSVASVSGMSGTGAGLGTIAATYLTGIVADRFSFQPVLLGASAIPLIAGIILWIFIREPQQQTRNT